MRLLTALVLVGLVACDGRTWAPQRGGASRASERSIAGLTLQSGGVPVPTCSRPEPASDGLGACGLAAGAMTFEMFAPVFARCWDAKNATLLEPLVDDLGLWVIYNIGAWERSYHIAGLSQALDSPGWAKGFGYLGATQFDCSPTLGTDPGIKNCTGEERTSACEFGAARVGLVGLLNRRVADAVQTREPKEVARLRGIAVAAQARVSRFMTDRSWGAVFYFGSFGGRWKLIAVSTADCSI